MYGLFYGGNLHTEIYVALSSVLKWQVLMSCHYCRGIFFVSKVGWVMVCATYLLKLQSFIYHWIAYELKNLLISFLKVRKGVMAELWYLMNINKLVGSYNCLKARASLPSTSRSRVMYKMNEDGKTNLQERQMQEHSSTFPQDCVHKPNFSK